MGFWIGGPSWPVYFDMNGHMWSVDPLDGMAREAAQGGWIRGYASSDCTGPVHIYALGGYPPPPRLVFVTGGALGNEYRVLPDDVSWRQLMFCSQMFTPGCQAQQCQTLPGVLESETTLVTQPVINAVAPYHPVLTAP